MKLLTRFCVLALAAALLTASTCAEAEVAAGPDTAAAPAGAALADGQCQVAPVGYEGPCPLGALPAFFDDFRYTSGHTTRSVADAPRGDIFGENAWMTAEGEEVTRAWYRFNRDNHPVPGRISFNDGVMRLLVPAGTSAEDFVRSLILHTGATFHAGTYHYRVRLSPLWEGQQLRQTAWTMSPDLFFFEPPAHQQRQRYRYWSELDFENENHFQGGRVAGRLVPDFVTRMSVGNHYGRLDQHRDATFALSTRGPVHFMTGRGALARDGFARHPHNAAAPLIEDWSVRWLDLLIHADPATRQSTYRMVPVQNDPQLRQVSERPLRIDRAFYPRRPMHFAFSLHWLEPEGHLQNDFWMDVDWIYHSPISGLSVDDIDEQVRHLRLQGHPRVNTTGSRTYRDHGVPLEATIAGPATIQCGDQGSWRMTVNRAGFVHATLRMRTISTTGATGSWHPIYDFDVELQPSSRDRFIEIEGSVQDRWRPHGSVIDEVTGWQHPHPDNETATARRQITVTC